MSKVIVFLNDDENGQVWEGDYDVALSPGNSLIVTENTKLSGPKIRCLYNEATWKQAVINDKADRDTD